MSQQYPDTEDSQEAKDGTAAHEIAAEMINGATHGHSHKAHYFVGQAASNGVIFTDEMFEAAEIFADNVISEMRSRAIFGGPDLGIEKRIEAKRIHELSFGTVDTFIFDKKTGTLIIWDFKFGFGLVEVFENWQLINYAAGILEKLDTDGIYDQHISVRFRIIQPRAFHRDGETREWIVLASDLRSYFNILYNNAHSALGPNPICHSGFHCKNCSARSNCSTALTAGLKLYEIVEKPTPINLSPEAAGVQYAIILRTLKQLEYLESGFKEQIKGLITSGVNVPGWMVEQGVGREKWVKPIPEVIALGKMLGYDLRKPDELITPNQARKTGIDHAVIAEYTEKPRTGLKLVPDNTTKAKQVFNYEQ